MRISFFVFLLSILPLPCCSSPTGSVPLSADAPTATGWQMKTIVSGLHHPWGMVWLDENEMLITERRGTVRRVKNGKLLEEFVKGAPKVLS